MRIALMDRVTKEEMQDIVQNSFSFSEVLNKLGYASKSGDSVKKLRIKLETLNIDTSHFKLNQHNTKRTFDNVFCTNSTADQKTLRKWFTDGQYTSYVCSICGQQPVWNNQPLTLILDHINGTNNDNRLENLRWVCPNCNQQLPTTNARNIHYHNK